MSGYRSRGSCITTTTTGTCYCKIGEAFLWQLYSDREKTGIVMRLKHEVGVNHFPSAFRQKCMHAQMHGASCQHFLIPSTGVQKQHLRTLRCKATVALAPKAKQRQLASGRRTSSSLGFCGRFFFYFLT